ERLDRAAADGPAASLARAAASGFLFLAQRRVEIGAGIARQLLAKLVAQHAALDLDRLALGEIAELERAVGDADQPVDVEADAGEHLLHFPVLALAEPDRRPD